MNLFQGSVLLILFQEAAAFRFPSYRKIEQSASWEATLQKHQHHRKRDLFNAICASNCQETMIDGDVFSLTLQNGAVIKVAANNDRLKALEGRIKTLEQERYNLKKATLLGELCRVYR